MDVLYRARTPQPISSLHGHPGITTSMSRIFRREKKIMFIIPYIAIGRCVECIWTARRRHHRQPAGRPTDRPPRYAADLRPVAVTVVRLIRPAADRSVTPVVRQPTGRKTVCYVGKDAHGHSRTDERTDGRLNAVMRGSLSRPLSVEEKRNIRSATRTTDCFTLLYRLHSSAIRLVVGPVVVDIHH